MQAKTANPLSNVQVIHWRDRVQHGDALIIDIRRGTIFGNPVTIKQAGSREQAIKLYRQRIWAAVTKTDMKQHDTLRAALRSLLRAAKSGAEIRLACACKPKSCHGDVLLRFLRHYANINQGRS